MSAPPGAATVLDAGTTLGAALAAIAARLAEAGIEEPRREARLLLAAAIGTDLAALIAREAMPLGGRAGAVEAMLRRRAAREPLSRILGRREFHGLGFRLNAATLDPRPDTETLVDAVLAAIDAGGGRGAALSILDLGTGSGAILLALLHLLPTARGLGVDLAPEALAMAAENAAALGLAARARFVRGDLFEGLGAARFDILVSNPPYIETAALAALDPEVRDHDPRLALDGGADGLAFYRRIAAGAGAHLRPGGLVALEIGRDQAVPVAAMLAVAGITDIATRRDLGGITRVVLGRVAMPAAGA